MKIVVGWQSFMPLLFVTFLVLKLTDVVAWSWWWVAAPLWVPATLAVVALLVGVALVVSEEMSK